MARLEERLSENAPGPLFVDSSCIDCGICREVAPLTFSSSPRGRSYVSVQPRTPAGGLRAAMALVSCPTASIGTSDRRWVREAVSALPEEILPGVEYCGFASAATYGAASYLVRRSEGNVLVDSPRATLPLFERIGERGGVDLMFLTHGDDVGDHAAFHRRFGCTRILHEGDARRADPVERTLSGRDPVALAQDLLAIPLPGHTRGSVALLYAGAVLFTGDHLFASEDGETLVASREVCWYSWAEQVRSMERLLDHSFEWVLPGHGRRFHRSRPAMRAAISELLERMKGGRP
jgi:glyoxylase-like metal-dependent hydrolase (beta-lactamase superfamily II)/ferredoxin